MEYWKCFHFERLKKGKSGSKHEFDRTAFNWIVNTIETQRYFLLYDMKNLLD